VYTKTSFRISEDLFILCSSDVILICQTFLWTARTVLNGVHHLHIMQSLLSFT